LLNDADFRSAEAMALAINQALGRSAAHVLDSRRVELSVANGEEIPALLAQVESIEVPVFPRAKVVVNERTGTVVIGGTVVLQPVSILHGGLAVNVVSEFQVSHRTLSRPARRRLCNRRESMHRQTSQSH